MISKERPMPIDDAPDQSERTRALARLAEVRRRAGRRRLGHLAILVIVPTLVVVLAITLPLRTGGTHRQEVTVGRNSTSVPSTTSPPSTDSSTTSSTTPETSSTTATTALGPVPGTPNCVPNRPGSGIKPSLIFFGCATSADSLSDIQWDAWTAVIATGTATHNINDCLRGGPNPPSCAEGKYAS